jgi:hypothetical protein
LFIEFPEIAVVLNGGMKPPTVIISLVVGDFSPLIVWWHGVTNSYFRKFNEQISQ